MTDVDLFALPRLTGQWFIANTGTQPPAMTVQEGAFVDPWPTAWTPVGAPNLTAVVKFDADFGHTLRFTDPSQAMHTIPNAGEFALGCDDPTSRTRIICPVATRDAGVGLRLLPTRGSAFHMFVAGRQLEPAKQDQ